MSKKKINTKKAPAAVGPYVQAVDTGKTLYCSGQLGIDPSTQQMPHSVREQATYSMHNVEAILKEAGYTLQDIVKTTIFLTDMNDFKEVNEIYKGFFGESFPARSCYQVVKLPLNGLVEIECIAVKE